MWVYNHNHNQCFYNSCCPDWVWMSLDLISWSWSQWKDLYFIHFDHFCFVIFRLSDHVADKTKQPILIFPEGVYDATIPQNTGVEPILFSADESFPLCLLQVLASTTHQWWCSKRAALKLVAPSIQLPLRWELLSVFIFPVLLILL